MLIYIQNKAKRKKIIVKKMSSKKFNKNIYKLSSRNDVSLKQYSSWNFIPKYLIRVNKQHVNSEKI